MTSPAHDAMMLFGALPLLMYKQTCSTAAVSKLYDEVLKQLMISVEGQCRVGYGYLHGVVCGLWLGQQLLEPAGM